MMSRTASLAIAAYAVAAVSTTAISPALAVEGCCNERESYADPWRKNGASFDACDLKNTEKDKDNVFDESGFVWWDSSCR